MLQLDILNLDNSLNLIKIWFLSQLSNFNFNIMHQTISSIAAKKAGLELDSIKNLSDVSRKAVELGGRILMDHYGKLTNIKNKGRSGDLVTEADLECESEIIKLLQRETPEISIIAEETGTKDRGGNLSWCLDPLDGTTNFAHSYPLFGTSLGLVWNDMPLLGAISVPFINEIYWAAPQIGAYCNQECIQTSNCKSLIDSLLVTGFAYDRFTIEDNNYSEFCWMTHRSRGVRRGGAAAIDLAFVAAGRLDGYWERGLSKWDLAAGVAIVEIAGGFISDYPSGKFDLNNGRILACTQGISCQMKKELEKVRPLDCHLYGAEKTIESLNSKRS